MLHRYIFRNAKMMPMDEAHLSPGQAGLLNGWGLFTTLRILEGEPFAFERHWKRLQKDAGRTHIPFAFQMEEVRGQLRELIRANSVNEGCARIYIVYNKIGFWSGAGPFPDVDIILYTTDPPSFRDPARLALREQGRHAGSPLAGVKVTSWLVNVLNLYEAQQRGFDEVVLLNERGEVAECTAANIFCVRAGNVYTPPTASGCLEGVTRAVLMEIGPSVGAPIEERTLYPEDLYTADEVFISSTNRTRLSVSEIESHKITAAPGPVTQKLERAFLDHLHDYVVRSRAAASAKP